MEKLVSFSDTKWHASHLKFSRMPRSNRNAIWLLKAVFERKDTFQTLDFSSSHDLLEIYGWRVGTGWINYKSYLAEYQKEGKARSLHWGCVTAMALKGRAEHVALPRLATPQNPLWATKQSHRDLTRELLSKQKFLYFLLIQYPFYSFLVRKSIFMTVSCKVYVIWGPLLSEAGATAVSWSSPGLRNNNNRRN